MKIRDKVDNEVYETEIIAVVVKKEGKDGYYSMDFTSIKDLTDTLEDYEKPKATLKDIVSCTTAGKKAMEKALKKSCEEQVKLLERR